MRKIAQLEKSTKIFILIMMAATLLSVIAIAVLDITNNFRSDLMANFFTGDTESEISVEEAISYERREIEDEKIDKGVTEIRQKGIEGKKRVIFRVTKDRDGNEINRSFVREEIISNPEDEIIAIGTRPDISSATYDGSITGSYTFVVPLDNSTSGVNPSGGESSPGGQGGVSTHYCTTPRPGWDGRNHRRFYLKTNVPCGTTGTPWDNHNIEVTSNEYYSHDLYSSYHNPGDPIEEIRDEKCGSDYSSPDPFCKIY